MIYTHNLELIDNHLVIQVGLKRALIDTGCPFTFGKEDKLSFLRKEHRVLTRVPGINILNMKK